MRVFSFWQGSRLGPVEMVSLRSHVANGHEVDLYTYEDVGPLPAGVHRLDADEVIPRKDFFLVSWRGERVPITFSDFFRFARICRQGGTWIDLDAVCLKSYSGIGTPYFIGDEAEGRIGVGVISLPAAHPAAIRVLSHFRNPGRFFFSRLFSPERFGEWGKNLLGFLVSGVAPTASYSLAQWGALGGPRAATVLRDEGLFRDVAILPEKTFYPVPWTIARSVIDPTYDFRWILNDPGVFGVHLYGSGLRRRIRSGTPDAGTLWGHLKETFR